MPNKILMLPLAITDDETVRTRGYLSRQIPILLRNCIENERPGSLVASPLAMEVEGRRLWVVHREPMTPTEAATFASERGYDQVVVGALRPESEGADESWALSLQGISAGDESVILELEIKGGLFRIARRALACVGGLLELEPERAEALFSPPTLSPTAYEHYLCGLDHLLALRSPGMTTPEETPPLEPFIEALRLDAEFSDALTAGLSCALQLSEDDSGEPSANVLETLKGWSDAFPADARIWAVRAEILIQRERRPEALNVLRRGLQEAKPFNRDLLRRSADVLVDIGRQSEAFDAYRACQKLEYEAKIAERMVTIAIMLGRDEDAEKLIERLLEGDPERSDLWGRAALVAQRRGDQERMWSCYARMFDGAFGPGAEDLARLNVILSNATPTPEFVERVRTWYPPESFDPARRILLGKGLRLAGATIEAGMCLKSIAGADLDVDGRVTLARENLNLAQTGFDERFGALARQIVGEKKTPETDLLERALTDQPDFWPAGFLLGLVSSTRKDHAKALEWFDAVIGTHAGNDVVWYTRGLQLVHLRRDEDACVSFRRAIELNDDQVDYHANLALAAARLGEIVEARAALARLCRLAPDHPDEKRIRGLIERA